MTTPIAGILGGFENDALKTFTSWILAGVAAALREVAHVIGSVTSPNLGSVWFTTNYWRMTEIASLLTVPFLFAAAIEAVLKADLALLVRATFLQLPLALIGVSIAAPIVTLLLSATDELCAFVGGGGVDNGSRFLLKAAGVVTVANAGVSAPLLVMLGIFTIMAAISLTLELLVREAAVYIVVLMLPLAFAALVWPARRIWTVRMLELLVALILSKFVIVSILTLAGDAFGSTLLGVSQQMTAAALLVMACFSPWAVLKLLPFTELHSHATDGMRQQTRQSFGTPLRQAAEFAATAGGGLPEEMAGRAAADGQGFAAPDLRHSSDGIQPMSAGGGAARERRTTDAETAATGDEATTRGAPITAGATSHEDAVRWYEAMVRERTQGPNPGTEGATELTSIGEAAPGPNRDWTPTIEFDEGQDLDRGWATDLDRGEPDADGPAPGPEEAL